jgi:hypothetical protein
VRAGLSHRSDEFGIEGPGGRGGSDYIVRHSGPTGALPANDVLSDPKLGKEFFDEGRTNGGAK